MAGGIASRSEKWQKGDVAAGAEPHAGRNLVHGSRSMQHGRLCLGAEGGRGRVLWFFVAWAALAVLLGCGRKPPQEVIESAATLKLNPGSGYRFADEFLWSREAAGLARGGDGIMRLSARHLSQPALPAPVGTVYRKRVSLPEGTRLWTGFGIVSRSESGTGHGVRFLARLITPERTVELLSREVREGDPARRAVWTPVPVTLPSVPGECDLELSVELLPNSQPPAADWQPVWVNPMLIAPRDPPRPNVVVILVDALRADRLGCYGGPPDNTPFLDEFARESVVFEDASSQATWTLPSVLSMLTSSYPLLSASLGVSLTLPSEGDQSGDIRPVRVPRSLQEEMQKLGYTTIALVDGGFLDPALGLCHGFDQYQSPFGQIHDLSEHLSRLVEKLNKLQGTPVFAFVQRILDAMRARKGKLRPADVQRLLDLYVEEIRETDSILRDFVRALLDGPLGDNTAIFMIADHGEAFDEHGQSHHAGIPYRELYHVPLLLRLPHREHAGRRVDTPVALADLMPTILELAGAQAPPGLVGRSLLSTLEPREESEPRCFLAEARGHVVMARRGTWTYYTWLDQDREELYDLAADPGQTRNLVKRAPSALASARLALARETMRGGRGYRLVVAGPRAEPVTVELSAAKGFATLPAGRGMEKEEQRVRATFPAGDDVHVVLFMPRHADDEVMVTARTGGATVGTERIHLGPRQTSPGLLPVRLVLTKMKGQLVSDTPTAPEKPREWGIWLWAPSTAVPRPGESGLPTTVELPEDLGRQLRALGYVE